MEAVGLFTLIGAASGGLIGGLTGAIWNIAQKPFPVVTNESKTSSTKDKAVAPILPPSMGHSEGRTTLTPALSVVPAKAPPPPAKVTPTPTPVLPATSLPLPSGYPIVQAEPMMQAEQECRHFFDNIPDEDTALIVNASTSGDVVGPRLKMTSAERISAVGTMKDYKGTGFTLLLPNPTTNTISLAHQLRDLLLESGLICIQEVRIASDEQYPTGIYIANSDKKDAAKQLDTLLRQLNDTAPRDSAVNLNDFAYLNEQKETGDPDDSIDIVVAP